MTGAEYRRRDRPHFFNFLALERIALRDAPKAIGGVEGAVVSGDDRTGARAFVVELPAGWRSSHDGAEASLEFFVLRGDLSMEGERVGASGYVHLPQRCGGGELGSENGALALVFWNPNAPAFPPPYTRNRALRVWQEEWQPSMPGSHGFMHKSLRLPDPSGQGYDGGPGGLLRLWYVAPGIDTPFEHVHHECFEEMFLLQGDCLIADEGLMGLGTATIHPQEWWHGPFATRGGCIVLVHTDAPMGFPWPPRPDPDYPIAKRLCETYLDEAPWDVQAEHTPWAGTPWARLQEDPAFQKWAKSAEEFGDEVGRDTVASFRAGLRVEGGWQWRKR